MGRTIGEHLGLDRKSPGKHQKSHSQKMARVNWGRFGIYKEVHQPKLDVIHVGRDWDVVIRATGEILKTCEGPEEAWVFCQAWLKEQGESNGN